MFHCDLAPFCVLVPLFLFGGYGLTLFRMGLFSPDPALLYIFLCNIYARGYLIREKSCKIDIAGSFSEEISGAFYLRSERERSELSLDRPAVYIF